MKNILLSFIGYNDAGKLIEQDDGSIITALKNEKYDEAVLLWNERNVDKIKFSEITTYLKNEIINRKLANKVNCIEVKIEDVTNHNEVYKKLKKVTDALIKNKSIKYTSAISSGTPAMQVCWILLAESGDFSEKYPLRLIKVKDPKFGKSVNELVKLETSLPKIIKLKEENENLKKDLIPTAIISIDKGELSINKEIIKLSPIEFSYYRYFAERATEGKDLEKFSDIIIPSSFLEKIYKYHEESFPVLDINREEIRKAIRDGKELSISTFRGNISKINRKIKELLKNKTLIELYSISIEGKRGAKFYGIKAGKEKIKIT